MKLSRAQQAALAYAVSRGDPAAFGVIYRGIDGRVDTLRRLAKLGLGDLLTAADQPPRTVDEIYKLRLNERGIKEGWNRSLNDYASFLTEEERRVLQNGLNAPGHLVEGAATTLARLRARGLVVDRQLSEGGIHLAQGIAGRDDVVGYTLPQEMWQREDCPYEPESPSQQQIHDVAYPNRWTMIRRMGSSTHTRGVEYRRGADKILLSFGTDGRFFSARHSTHTVTNLATVIAYLRRTPEY